MNEDLSLRKYCISCGAKCCKTGNLIGSPILSEHEALKIKENIKEVISHAGQKYYVFSGQGRCFFLTKNNECRIQNIKPLDCLCYPIKAIYTNENKIKFIIDADCPAAKHLSNEFIENAKKIALKSIERFDKELYNRWLNKHVGWVKKGVDLDKFLMK